MCVLTCVRACVCVLWVCGCGVAHAEASVSTFKMPPRVLAKKKKRPQLTKCERFAGTHRGVLTLQTEGVRPRERERKGEKLKKKNSHKKQLV